MFDTVLEQKNNRWGVFKNNQVHQRQKTGAGLS